MKFPPWTSVSEAARLLKEGEVVAIPTETVYGLAGNAYNPEALAKIFAAKERPTFDPLIVHIADIAELENVARDIPESAYRLAEAFWPGPMTIILPKKDCIPDLCTSGLPSVAVRFPSHPVAQAIIKESGLPLAAPSANLFKHVSPTTAEHVAAQLADRIAGIVDGGSAPLPSRSLLLSPGRQWKRRGNATRITSLPYHFISEPFPQTTNCRNIPCALHSGNRPGRFPPQ